MNIQPHHLHHILTHHLRPHVKAIDEQALYPADFLRLLGEQGFYSTSPADNLRLIREVATVCVSTAFAVWCQAAAISFVANGGSEELKRELLPSLLSGKVLGGTGISNAMKFYAGMEPLKLWGEKTPTGYRINGTLPFVSNLTSHGRFGVVFQTEANERVMALAPVETEGLRLKEVQGFLGLNGTATCSCQFEAAEIPHKYILTEKADEWIAKVRPGFLLTQVGLGLGLTRACIESMADLKAKQNEANRYLQQQPEELDQRLNQLTERAFALADNPVPGKEYFKQVVAARLDSAYLALDAAQAEVLHAGAAGYVAGSPTSRRLRESYFLAVVTPAVKQLEKMLQNLYRD